MSNYYIKRVRLHRRQTVANRNPKSERSDWSGQHTVHRGGIDSEHRAMAIGRVPQVEALPTIWKFHHFDIHREIWTHSWCQVEGVKKVVSAVSTVSTGDRAARKRDLVFWKGADNMTTREARRADMK